MLITSPSSPFVLLKKDDGSLDDWCEEPGNENENYDKFSRCQTPNFSKVSSLVEDHCLYNSWKAKS